jgi:co-chaperonin GroES (HSP10)
MPDGSAYDVSPATTDATVVVDGVAASAKTSDVTDISDSEELERIESLERKLPKPTGYKLLIGLPRQEEKTKGGIIKAKQTLHREEVGSICGLVLEMGPDAYVDKGRFPNGPYCERGDWIVMRAYSGTRFQIDGSEYRLINDDSVEGVVADPRGITKL